MLSKFRVLASEIFVLISALFQLISMIKENNMGTFWMIALIALIVVNVILIAAEIQNIAKQQEKVIPRPNPERISRYLLGWIRSGSRIAIVSRDLSWVEKDIKAELLKKAKERELIVFLPKGNDVSRELMENGAEVKYYLYGTDRIQQDDYTILSRFTVAGYESAPRLTTPVISNDFHINEEFETNEPPQKIASDMIDIMRKTIHHTEPFDNCDKKAINDYLIKWLRNGGRCFVLSRDLSWAEDKDVKECMKDKAQRGEITIFMQEECDISEELVRSGADVRYYGSHGYVFKNRFIISHWGTADAKVTVHSVEGSVHINHVYDKNHRLFFYPIEIADFLDKVIPIPSDTNAVN